MRRRRTADEIVAAAVEVMAEKGAAGLTLGEVAKRVGMRTPSLYGYFASRSALCDDIFGRGWSALAEVMRPHYAGLPGTTPAQVHDHLSAGMSAFVGWALEHRAEAELMFWRPVSGWEPDPSAYAHAEELFTMFSGWVAAAQQAGALRGDVDPAELVDVLVTLTAGVITQQLANEPGVADVPAGRYSRLIDVLIDTYLTRYGTGGDRPCSPTTTSPGKRRTTSRRRPRTSP